MTGVYSQPPRLATDVFWTLRQTTESCEDKFNQCEFWLKLDLRTDQDLLRSNSGLAPFEIL